MTPDPTSIGRYKVINRLGHGGMGALFLAHDPAIDRMVAIKVMREGMDNAELRARFGREARAAGRLRHPNVVTIFDVGEDNGQPFIAMEYVPGETLEAIIQRRSRLPLSRKLKLIEELCDGLAYAHKAGVVHRDIKPANLMLDSDGMLKILDFGIVRFAQSGMTQAGMLVGTLAYMSPEQVAGKAVDYRSDIFAVGDVAYELLSGKQAFPGNLQDGIMNRILHEPPKPLDQLVPGLDPEIVKVISRALEKDPANRYPDLSRMRRDLGRIRERLEEAEEEAAEQDSASAETVASGPGRAPKHDSSAETMPRLPTGSDARAASRREMEQRRQARIRESLEAAIRAFEAGDFQAAIAAADDAAILDPNNERAVDIIERAQAAADDKQVRDWLDEAREHLNRGDATQAAALVDQARGLRPGSADVRGVQQAVDEVRHELELARERAQIVREAITRARADYAAGAFESAVRAAAEALARQPQHTEALEIRDQAAAALEQQRARERHERAAAQAIDGARRQFEAGQHDEAIQTLQQFQPPHADVSRTLEELQRQAVEIKRRREEEEREARRRKVAALTAAAQQGAADGRFDDAIGLLERARELDPESQTTAALLRQVLDLRSAAEAAARLRMEVEGRLAQAAAALERDDLGEASQIWADAIKLDPQSAAAVAFEKAIADKADALLSSAKQASEGGRYEQAIELATRVRALQSHVDAAEAVVQETRQRKAAAEAAARTRALIAEKTAAAANALERDDLQAAAGLYREAREIDSTSSAVAELEDALQRRARDLLAEARTAFDNGRLEPALHLVQRVRELDPGSPPADLLERSIVERQTAEEAAARLRARVEQTIAQASVALERGQLGVAARLHDEASTLDAGHAGLAALNAEIARRRTTVETHSAAAREAISRQQYKEALVEIDAARAIDADSRVLPELAEQATAGLAAIEREERRRSQLAAALAGSAEKLERGELDDALRLANEARTLEPANAEALALRQRVQQALDARAEQERVEGERRATQARIAAALEKARAARPHDQAIRILREALAVDAGSEELGALLREREHAVEAERLRAEEERREAERQAREARVARVLEKARNTRAHDQAIRMLRTALETDAGHAELLALLGERERAQEAERVRAEEERREAERRARDARVARTLDKARKSRSHDAALRILRDALTSEPDSTPLIAAIREREAALEAEALARATVPGTAAEAPSTVTGERPATSRGKWLMTIGGGIAAMLVLYLGISMMRKGEPPAQPLQPPVSVPAPATGTPAADPSPSTVPERREPPPPEPTTSVSAPADTTADPVTPAPLPKPADPKEDPATALERQLEPFRRRGRQELARGQFREALATAQSGLKLKADDQALRTVLTGVVTRASEEASQQRNAAEKSGAPTNALATYQEGVRQQTRAEGDRKAGRYTEAASGLWSARDTFARSADEAKQVAANEAERLRQQQMAEAKKKSESPPITSDPPKTSGTTAPITVPTPPAGPPAGSASRGESPAPADTTKSPEATPAIDERAAIQQAIRAYEAAFNAKSLDALRRAWIMSPAEAKQIETTFREAEEYKVAVDVQQITPAGDQATVTGLRRISFRNRFGTQNPRPVQTVFTLHKRGAGWIIVSVAAR